MKAWLKRLFHFHEWENIERGRMYHRSMLGGPDFERGIVYVQECRVCKKQRLITHTR